MAKRRIQEVADAAVDTAITTTTTSDGAAATCEEERKGPPPPPTPAPSSTPAVKRVRKKKPAAALQGAGDVDADAAMDTTTTTTTIDGAAATCEEREGPPPPPTPAAPSSTPAVKRVRKKKPAVAAALQGDADADAAMDTTTTIDGAAATCEEEREGSPPPTPAAPSSAPAVKRARKKKPAVAAASPSTGGDETPAPPPPLPDYLPPPPPVSGAVADDTLSSPPPTTPQTNNATVAAAHREPAAAVIHVNKRFSAPAPSVACDVRVDPDHDVLVLRTPQVGTLHRVFNAMKELMTDLTVVVDREQGSVSIDGYHRLLGYFVSTVLRFEQTICRYPKLTFSVPASSFYTMLTKASPKHTVYLFVPQSSFVNGNVDYIHFQFETPAASGQDEAPTRVFTISLPTLNDPDQDNYQLPPIAYPMRITLESAQFSKDMRDLAEFGGENLQIDIRNGDCFFSSVLQTGATLGGRIHYPDICASEEEEGSAMEPQQEDFAFRELFPLKTIKRIIKCGTLSSDVVIGVCAGVPLNFYYPIGADLGDMNVFLANAK